MDPTIKQVGEENDSPERPKEGAGGNKNDNRWLGEEEKE